MPFKKNIVTKKANKKPKANIAPSYPDPESPTPTAPEPVPPRSRASYYTKTEWSYETPLEQVPYPKRLHERVIEINGMKFQARSDTSYKINYYDLVDRVLAANEMTAAEKKKNPGENELNLFRNAIQIDLWFIVYFVMKNPLANHPFIVQACREIEDENSDTLQVWSRDHLKTTIISTGRQVQKVLNDPERRIGIFSATRPLAIKIQGLIKELFQSDFLKACFPDILYDNPQKDAPKWSEAPEGGLVVKRKGFYKEPTISSWGLVEGMPTGYHLTDIVCDDIVTQDLQTPDIMQKVCDNFDMLANIGTRDCQMTVVGTYYRHDDPLTYIAGKKDPVTNLPVFKVNKKAATHDGTLNGKAVFLPERTLAKRRAGQLYMFYCQQLLDPTPRGQEKLNRDNLITIKRSQLPENLYKFMLIDGAGDVGRRQDRKADAWAFAVVGIEPVRDNDGSNRIFILDMVIEDMDLITAQKEIVDMYLRNGRILKLCIEKVGMSSTEIHIVNALKAKKRFLSVEQGNLHILRPGGRSKQSRIENNLSWPLKNGKIHVLDTVPIAYKERLGLEMEKFPMWNDDGLDMLSYVYDVAKEYRFGAKHSGHQEDDRGKQVDGWDEAFAKARQGMGGKELSWVEV